MLKMDLRRLSQAVDASIRQGVQRIVTEFGSQQCGEDCFFSLGTHHNQEASECIHNVWRHSSETRRAVCRFEVKN